MSDPTPWMLFAFCVLLLIISLLIGHRLDILSRRIDIVHRRITMNNKLSGIKGDDWHSDDPVGNAGDSGK